MSDNQSPEPALPTYDSEGGPKQVGRRYNLARTLIMLGVFVGALLWTSRIVWERRHPAVAAARGLTAGTVSERLTAVRNLTDAGITDSAVAIPRMTAALNDPDAGVRAAAIESVGLLISYSIRSRASENEVRAAVVPLLASLKDTQVAVRLAAVRVLSMIRAAAPATSRQTPKKDAEKASPLIEANVMIVAMTAMLGDHDATIRAAAVRSLCEASTADPAAGLSTSSVALVDQDPSVRAAAAEAVGGLIAHAIRNRSGENEARTAAPKLVASLKDPDASVRTAGIQALSTIGAASVSGSRPKPDQGSQELRPLIDGGELVAAFTESLGDQESSVRVAAAPRTGPAPAVGDPDGGRPSPGFGPRKSRLRRARSGDPCARPTRAPDRRSHPCLDRGPQGAG